MTLAMERRRAPSPEREADAKPWGPESGLAASRQGVCIGSTQAV